MQKKNLKLSDFDPQNTSLVRTIIKKEVNICNGFKHKLNIFCNIKGNFEWGESLHFQKFWMFTMNSSTVIQHAKLVYYILPLGHFLIYLMNTSSKCYFAVNYHLKVKVTGYHPGIQCARVLLSLMLLVTDKPGPGWSAYAAARYNYVPCILYASNK